jgi:hypothetical protein
VQLTLDLTFDEAVVAEEPIEAPTLEVLPHAAAKVLAEIIRAYRAEHRLDGTGEAELGDWGDDPTASGVCGVHPHEHRRSAVA